ncbi:hypothetical protein K7459_21315 [Pseudomonas fluorescens]|nr:hypothetical protein [Pseudomonas fluorescens]MBY9030051.1 hypothetical protein [Pseudomonas fluorescens]MBY9038024.1 hypothetical protein [Pseudomonas fluorescens]MBY9044128.1 hypothetical protein [Pseudomonas fluorescens]MBY9049828.1 hypothetical protein [Pseudomonas fluorescens]
MEFAPPAAEPNSQTDNPEQELAALDLPQAVQSTTLKLLQQIALAHTADDLFRASDRAEGFVLGLETVEALDAVRIMALYEVFDSAATAQRQEYEQ